MKSLKEFEAELNKCSKCGLCQQACPIFAITQNECCVSKGKFIMLHGVTKGDLKLSKNINKYLDMCLKCNKCSRFCPSSIDVCKILNTAKYEYAKNTLTGKLIFFAQSKFIFSNIIKILSCINKLINKTDKQYKKNETDITVLYFKGCVNQIFPSTDKYISKIFKKHPIKIITPDFECCGLPFLSEGNLERFEQAAKTNIKKMSLQYDYLITDCASCEDTLHNYPKYIEDYSFDQTKSINWGDLISNLNIKFKFNHPLKVTFHKPCHLKDDSFFEKIIKNCENIEYIKMKNYDDCCGLSGSFFIKNPRLSNELIKQKTKNIISSNADYVITSCPACLLGIKKGLWEAKSKTKAVSLLEFLAMATDIH